MTFDPAVHEYRDGDVVIPSVTQILKMAGLVDDRFYTDEARERGSAVHELCERYAHGIRVDNLGRPLASLEYVNAFAAWMKKSRAYAIETESVICHEIDGKRYAGKFDLLAEIAGRRVLIDYKTGGKAPSHIVQIAAYALACKPDKAMVLYLRPDGKYIESWATPAQLIDSARKFRRALCVI